MTRVLVTGATGLLGGAVVPLLRAAGHHVSTTSRTATSSASHQVADLLDRDSVSALLEAVRPEVVLHLAGGAAATCVGLADANVRATSELLAGLSRAGVRLERLVVTGSAAEYGEGSGAPIREDAPLAPVTPYGQAKAAQTWLVQLLAPEVAQSVVIARPFNVVAADLPAGSPLGNLRRQLQEQGATHIRCGRLDVERDFVSLRFIASALVGLVSAPDAPRAVNLCSGRPVRLGDVFAEVVRQSGVTARLVPDPALSDLAAATSVVGDAALLGTLGFRTTESLADLAATVLGRARD